MSVYGFSENKCRVPVTKQSEFEQFKEKINTDFGTSQEENNDFLVKKMLLNMGKEIQPVVKAKYKDNTSITKGEYIETRFVEDFSEMFSGCTALTSVPEYDTAYATNMKDMFLRCNALTSIPDLDTSNVTNMFRLLNGCSKVTSIPDFDTSNVTNMGFMFCACTALTRIPEMDTSKVTNMEQIFNGCSKVTSIPDLDTSNVTRMQYMFSNCNLLTSIPTLNTSNTQEIHYMFYNCSNLTTIPDLDTRKVMNFEGMFRNCANLTSVPDLDIGCFIDGTYTYYDYIQEKEMTSSGTVNKLFDGCSSLTTLRDNPYAPEGSRWQFKTDVDFSSCPLDRTSILKVFNGLQTVTSKKTIKISSITNGYLSGDDKNIAKNKNWTVTVV